MKSAENTNTAAVLVYDGHCPFCSRYASYVRLQKAVGELTLLDAREDHLIVKEIIAAGYNLDEGMVLKYAGRYYHGSECIHTLALLSTPSDMFNRINALVFKHAGLASILYPVLRFCRNLVLVLLGREKIQKKN